MPSGVAPRGMGAHGLEADAFGRRIRAAGSRPTRRPTETCAARSVPARRVLPLVLGGQATPGPAAVALGVGEGHVHDRIAFGASTASNVPGLGTRQVQRRHTVMSQL